MDSMAFTDKAKDIADTALQRIGEYSEKAGEKAAELAEQARERAPEYLDKAVDLAEKAADVTAAGVDKATGGRFHEKIDAAHDKVGETLGRARGKDDTPGGDVPGPGPS